MCLQAFIVIHKTPVFVSQPVNLKFQLLNQILAVVRHACIARNGLLEFGDTLGCLLKRAAYNMFRRHNALKHLLTHLVLYLGDFAF